MASTALGVGRINFHFWCPRKVTAGSVRIPVGPSGTSAVAAVMVAGCVTVRPTMSLNIGLDVCLAADDEGCDDDDDDDDRS